MAANLIDVLALLLAAECVLDAERACGGRWPGYDGATVRETCGGLADLAANYGGLGEECRGVLKRMMRKPKGGCL